MSVFSMFVGSPPAGAPVATIYREKQAFGPYNAGGELKFSPQLELQIAESAPAVFRTLRAVCRGQLRVLGNQDNYPPTDPARPLVVQLEPYYPEMHDLVTVCRAANIETPTAFVYWGVSRAAFSQQISPHIDAAPSLVAASPADRLARFLQGEFPVRVPRGFVLGEASALTETAGYRTVGFAAKTGPGNFLDPVVLYRHLSVAMLPPFATPAMSDEERTNSWLDVATRSRVLITIRNEWNEPMVSSTEVVEVGGPSGVATLPLTDPGGTLIVPPAWSEYRLRIEGRKLTPIPSDEKGLSQLSLAATAPDHRVIGTVNPADWFSPCSPGFADTSKELFLYTEGNLVEALVDGNEYFGRLVDDLKRVDSAIGFVLVQGGWGTKHDFPLVTGRSDTTLGRLLADAAANGAKIRAIFWDSPWRSNRLAHLFINGLPDTPPHSPTDRSAASIIDSRTHHALNLPVSEFVASQILGQLPPIAGIGYGMFLTSLYTGVHHLGSHHTKCFVIRNSQEELGYVGGIDIQDNRLDDSRHAAETPYHDVQTRITGPAVSEIAKVFVDRWNDHPDRVGTIASVPVSLAQTGTSMVQVARTYGAGVQTYAPAGDRTIWESLQKAIRRARRYIYIEDQYLWYAKLGQELHGALTANPELRVIIVLDGTSAFYLPENYARGDRARYLVLRPLYEDYPDRVHVFTLAITDRTHTAQTYKVHSKLAIVDDLFATVGSANLGQRSMTHDSELNVFVLDGRVEDGARKFARDLRIRLWTDHLGLYDGANSMSVQRLHMGDLNTAIARLLGKSSPPIYTSRLVPYDHSIGAGTAPLPEFEAVIDPDGSTPP